MTVAVHRLITTHTFAVDCGHENPDEAERFEDAFQDLTFDEMKAHPLWTEYSTALEQYEETHLGDLCNAPESEGEGCLDCGSDDLGFGDCELPMGDPDRAVHVTMVPA